MFCQLRIFFFLLLILSGSTLRAQEQVTSATPDDRLDRLEAATPQGRDKTGFLYQIGNWFRDEVILGTYELGAGSWYRCFPPDQDVIFSKESVYPYRAGDSRQLLRRELTDPMLSFFRADYTYLHVNRDQHADDIRVELGLGPFAGQHRHTRLISSGPRDILNIEQWYAMLRLSISDTWEVDLGIGEMMFAGDEQVRKPAYTVPVLFYPQDWLGFEFRPAWARIQGNTVEDFEAAVVFRVSAVSLRLGHRWIRGIGESYDGAFVGASLHF